MSKHLSQENSHVQSKTFNSSSSPQMYTSPYARKTFPTPPNCLHSTPDPHGEYQHPYEIKSSPMVSNYSPSSRYSPAQHQSHLSPLRDHGSYSEPSSKLYSPEKINVAESYVNSPLSSPPKFYSTPPRKQVTVSELENNTIQKQRKELQLLIGELQDRDRELNEMVASHQKQLLTWERDRQRLLTLEQKCTRLQGEIKNRNDQVKSMSTRLKVMQSQDESKKCALDTMQRQLQQMSQESSMGKLKMSEMQDEVHRLNNLVQNLSTRGGQLEAREQELLTVIKLKDRDLTEAASHIAELTLKFKKLDLAHKQSRYSAESGKKEVSEWKMKYKEARKEADDITGELQQQTHLNTEQRVENGKLQEGIKALGRELSLTAEREKRRDQLIQLQRSKQERIDAELTSLRQAYERQYRDLSLVQLNLESEREKSREEENKQPSSTRTSPFTSRNNSMIQIEGVSPLVTPKKEEGMKGDESDGDQEEDEEEDSERENEKGEENQADLMGSTEDLIGENIGEGDASPTSKLHRLLSESRQMVATLEQAALPPYVQVNSHAEDNMDSQERGLKS